MIYDNIYIRQKYNIEDLEELLGKNLARIQNMFEDNLGAKQKIIENRLREMEKFKNKKNEHQMKEHKGDHVNSAFTSKLNTEESSSIGQS